MTFVGDWLYALKIEGVGDPSAAASDKLTRFSTGALADDPDALYTSALEEIPQGIEIEITFIDTDCELSAQTFVVQAEETVLGPLLFRSLFRYFARTPSPISATLLNIPLTVVIGAEADYNGTTAYVGREAIVLGTWNGGTSTYDGSVRGVLGTVAEAHNTDTDTEWYNVQHVISDRTAELIRVPRSGGYADEELIWRGALINVVADGAVRFSLECLDALELLQLRRFGLDAWRGTITNATGDPTWAISASGPGRPAAGYSGDERLTLSVAGKFAVVASYKVETLDDGAEWTTIGWRYDNDANGQHLLSPTREAVKIGDQVQEIFTCDPRQPATSATPGQQTLPHSRNPGTFLLQALTTTEHGNNGSYDIGKKPAGVGVNANLVHTEAFEALAARFAHYELGNLCLNLDGEGVDAWELVRRVLRPLQAAPTLFEGKISCTVLDSWVDYDDAAELTGEELLAGISLVRNLPAAFDQVVVEFGRVDFGAKPSKATSTGRTIRHRHYYGRRQSVDIDAALYSSPPEVAARVGLDFVEAFWRAFGVYEIETDGSQSFWPGRRLLLSSDSTWNVAGTLGVAQLGVVVISRGYDPATQAYKHAVLAVGSPIERAAYIGPSCKVHDFITAGSSSSGRPEVVVHREYFCDDAGDLIHPDSAGFLIGDKVELLDDDLDRLGVLYEGVEIYGVRENDDGSGYHADYDVLELVGTFAGTLQVDDVVVSADYTTTTPSQQQSWVHLADDDGLLDGGSEANPYQYTV